MKKEEIEELLKNEITPICQVEARLGIPKTTLQKAIKGERTLPQKWAIILKNAYENPFMKEAQRLPKKEEEYQEPEVIDTKINEVYEILDFAEILRIAKSGATKEDIEALIKANKKLTSGQIEMIKSKCKNI